jgi:hypothetical protein
MAAHGSADADATGGTGGRGSMAASLSAWMVAASWRGKREVRALGALLVAPAGRPLAVSGRGWGRLGPWLTGPARLDMGSLVPPPFDARGLAVAVAVAG